MQLSLNRKILFLLIVALLLFRNGRAQIKIGTSPTTLERSALLELNGNKQGLLLPRLADTSLINTLSPPDGMLIYFQPSNSGRGLYLRKSGHWQRITTDSVLSASLNSWNLTGNNGLTGSEKLGSLNAAPLNIITNNTNRIVIDATGATTITGNTTLGGTVTVNPAATATDITALLLNGSNTVVKRNLNTVAFTGAIQSINNLTTSAQSLVTNASAGSLGFASAGSIHTLTLPDADTANRGFINILAQAFTGNKTFNNNLSVSGITSLSPVLNTTDTSFLLINSSNQVTKRNFSSFTFPGIQNLNGLTASSQTFGTSSNQALFAFNSSGSAHTLNIPDADATFRGFVNTGTQTFSGNKTFSNNLSVTGITSLSPVLNTVDTGFLMINSSNQVTRRNFSTFPGINVLNGLTAATQSFTTSFSQNPLTFNSSGSLHTLNFPDADATYRGLVNTGTQSFTGNKTFSNNLTVSGTTTLAGATSATDTIFLMTNLTNSQVERRNITSLPFIQSINGLTVSAQTIATTNTPGTLGFTSTGSSHTLAIPDADVSTRGFVNTGAQTIAGAKTLNSTLVVNNTGSAGSSGLTLPKLTSATSETSGAKSIGVDASGVVVRTPTSPTFYTTGGTANITKVWIGQLTNTGGSGSLNFNISSAGFTNILGIQATAQKNTASTTQQPFATITTATTTNVTVKITRGYLMLILGNTLVTEDDPNTIVHLRVEGN